MVTVKWHLSAGGWIVADDESRERPGVVTPILPVWTTRTEHFVAIYQANLYHSALKYLSEASGTSDI